MRQYGAFDYDTWYEDDAEDLREYQETYAEWEFEKRKVVEKALRNAQSVLPEFKVVLLPNEGDKGRVYFGVRNK